MAELQQVISGVDVPYTNDCVRAGGKDLLEEYYSMNFVLLVFKLSPCYFRKRPFPCPVTNQLTNDDVRLNVLRCGIDVLGTEPSFLFSLYFFTLSPSLPFSFSLLCLIK